jgi:hypothetical protein
VPRLATVDSVRQRLGFDSLTTINEVIQSALDAATLYLQSALRTRFDRGVLTDVFSLYYYLKGL